VIGVKCKWELKLKPSCVRSLYGFIHYALMPLIRYVRIITIYERINHLLLYQHFMKVPMGYPSSRHLSRIRCSKLKVLVVQLVKSLGLALDT
jgi:hypothetical protein